MISHEYVKYDEEWGIEYVLYGEPGAWVLSMNGQGNVPMSDDAAIEFINSITESNWENRND